MTRSQPLAEHSRHRGKQTQQPYPGLVWGQEKTTVARGYWGRRVVQCECWGKGSGPASRASLEGLSRVWTLSSEFWESIGGLKQARGMFWIAFEKENYSGCCVENGWEAGWGMARVVTETPINRLLQEPKWEEWWLHADGCVETKENRHPRGCIKQEAASVTGVWGTDLRIVNTRIISKPNGW